MTTFEKETIMDAFWTDYFSRFPEPGSIPELNTLRKQFRPFLRPHRSENRVISRAVHGPDGRCLTCQGIHLAGPCPLAP